MKPFDKNTLILGKEIFLSPIEEKDKMRFVSYLGIAWDFKPELQVKANAEDLILKQFGEVCSIRLNTDNTLIGWLALSDGENEFQYDIYTFLFDVYKGDGYGKDAISAMLGFLSKKADIDSVSVQFTQDIEN